MTGKTRRNSSASPTGSGPRAGGFAAEIENFRALGDEFQRLRHGPGRVEKFPAIGKRIGGDVDHAHDERRARKDKFKLPGAENNVAGNGHNRIVNGFPQSPSPSVAWRVLNWWRRCCRRD